VENITKLDLTAVLIFVITLIVLLRVA